jgi:hypothetical protein
MKNEISERIERSLSDEGGLFYCDALHAPIRMRRIGVCMASSLKLQKI